MINIKLAGRTDIEDYFNKSGVLESDPLTHTPLLVFLATENTIMVQIVERPALLITFPDDTPVMGQWKGEWRSDFFQFTVGQFRKHFEEKYGVLRSAHNVVKRVGPKGGFRSLSYEYTDKDGVIRRPHITTKEEAAQVEALLGSHNIPISVETER